MKYRIIEVCKEGKPHFYLEQMCEYKTFPWSRTHTYWRKVMREGYYSDTLRTFTSITDAKRWIEKQHPKQNYTKVVDCVEV